MLRKVAGVGDGVMTANEQLTDLVAGGILPLTSACNTACAFCSHRFNPAGIKTVAVNPLSQADLELLLPTIARLSALTIGESASTIMEGEPLTHPRFRQIMQQIRDVAPQISMKLTTNGILLSDGMLAFLESIRPLELTISLNSTTQMGRRQLMGVGAGSTDGLLQRLAAGKLPWHASIVAMPHLVGMDDILETLQQSAQHGAVTIRVFLPGFTRLTPSSLRLPASMQAQLLHELAEWADAHSTPLLVEPRRLTDLRADIVGVIAGSPAENKLARHDAILAVDDAPVMSRIDAFDRLYTAMNPHVTFERDGVVANTQLIKAALSRSGIVVHSDMSPALMRRLRRRCSRRHSVWVLASTLGSDLLDACLPSEQYPNTHVITVANQTFGGSIGCAGLLTVADMIAGLPSGTRRPDILLLPKVAFDRSGNDITGVNYENVQAVTGCRVELL